MIAHISTLSLVAAGLYGVVVPACLLAARTSIHHRQQGWHKLVWLTLALLFAGLIAMRLAGVEDFVREGAREVLRDKGMYEGRRDFQRKLAAALVIVFAFAGGYVAIRFGRYLQGRRNAAAALGAACAVGMIVLLCMRFVSLHDIDRWLYGPLKLNWVGDLGITFLVLGAAIFYSRVVQASSGPAPVKRTSR